MEKIEKKSINYLEKRLKTLLQIWILHMPFYVNFQTTLFILPFFIHFTIWQDAHVRHEENHVWKRQYLWHKLVGYFLVSKLSVCKKQNFTNVITLRKFSRFGNKKCISFVLLQVFVWNRLINVMCRKQKQEKNVFFYPDIFFKSMLIKQPITSSSTSVKHRCNFESMWSWLYCVSHFVLFLYFLYHDQSRMKRESSYTENKDWAVLHRNWGHTSGRNHAFMEFKDFMLPCHFCLFKQLQVGNVSPSNHTAFSTRTQFQLSCAWRALEMNSFETLLRRWNCLDLNL